MISRTYIHWLQSSVSTTHLCTRQIEIELISLHQFLPACFPHGAYNAVVQLFTVLTLLGSTMPQSSEITELLHRWTAGEKEVLDSLLPVVERELRTIARKSLRRQRPGQTLQTTELVNEAYLRLVDQTRVQWQNRAHFFAIAAQIMRRVLLDHARRRNRTKRGAGANQISLSSVTIRSPQKSPELIALDEALTKLERADPFKSRVVELRYFGGLSLEDTAEVLNVAPVTVSRHWHLAKAWLKRELA